MTTDFISINALIIGAIGIVATEKRPHIRRLRLCTFWLVEALVCVGRAGEARRLMASALGALSPLGLLAEDYDPRTQRLWGNFPQAYSHVGLSHAAFAASPRWADVT